MSGSKSLNGECIMGACDPKLYTINRVSTFAYLFAADELIIRSQVAELAIVEALTSEGAEGKRLHLGVENWC